MRLAQEETEATHDVFNGQAIDVNEHFKSVGRALGLVRIKDILAGVILDLKQEIEETKPKETQNEDQPDSSKS